MAMHAAHQLFCVYDALLMIVSCSLFNANTVSLLHAQEARTQNRLQFLLRQAEIFQHFAPADTLQKAGKK
jgi:hypothetical protein